MGVVYEAEHESLKSRVALKVMHPRFRADPKYLRRFHAEARLAAGLHHTNIVGVFDYGEHDGVCYYAMQFIEGQPLDRVLDDIRRSRDGGTHADACGSSPMRSSPCRLGPPRSPHRPRERIPDRPLRRGDASGRRRRSQPVGQRATADRIDRGRSGITPGKAGPQIEAVRS